MNEWMNEWRPVRNWEQTTGIKNKKLVGLIKVTGSVVVENMDATRSKSHSILQGKLPVTYLLKVGTYATYKHAQLAGRYPASKYCA